MCKCTPNKRTPFCGAPGCEMPPQRREDPSRALVYAGILGQIQAVGREHGYAIAVHGSMATDLDLIAVPWTEEAADAEMLIQTLCDRLGGYVPTNLAGDPCSIKPHGRRAYSIHWKPKHDTRHLPDELWDLTNHAYLDISVIPKQTI